MKRIQSRVLLFGTGFWYLCHGMKPLHLHHNPCKSWPDVGTRGISNHYKGEK